MSTHGGRMSSSRPRPSPLRLEAYESVDLGSPVRPTQTPDRPRPSMGSTARSTGRGGERISNYTIASLDSATVAASPRRARAHLAARCRQALAGPALAPPRAADRLLERLGPIEMAEAVAPVMMVWAAYVLDRLQRQPDQRWDLATGALLLIGAGCLGHWQALEWAQAQARAQPAALPARGLGTLATAAALAAPLALLCASVATLRGQHLAQRASYTGGLLGAAFALAIDLHVVRRQLACLPSLPVRAASRGRELRAGLGTLCGGALVGLFGLAPRLDRWPWLLGTSALVAGHRFFSLCAARESASVDSHRQMRASAGHSSLTELLSRTESADASDGADHFLARPVASSSRYTFDSAGSVGRAL